MAANAMSRFFPSSGNQKNTGRRQQSDISDPDDPTGRAIDEENLEAQFHDQDLEELLAEAANDDTTTESTAFLSQDNARSPTAQRPGTRKKPKWMRHGIEPQPHVDEDDDVPDSLLLEEPGQKRLGKGRVKEVSGSGEIPPPMLGTPTQTARAQWQATRAQQRLHDEEDPPPSIPSPQPTRAFFVDPKDRAMYKWTNVKNLDNFLIDVYNYYIEHGIWSMLLKRFLLLLSTGFLVFFSTFLLNCIDYANLPKGKKTADILIPQCSKKLSGWTNLFLWVFVAYWVFTAIQFVMAIPSLKEMHDFYHHLLDIPDSDIQTVSWPMVVGRLMALRESNAMTAEQGPGHRRFLGGQTKLRMDAQDIANRIMRKENYLIALINKDILDLTVPIPFLGNRQFLTRSVEWTIGFILMDYAFNQEHITPGLLDMKRRDEVVKKLQARMKTIGVIHIIFAPFVCFFYLAHQLFSNFVEYQKNPSYLGSRAFSILAEWKFREFNELPHFFHRRMSNTGPYAAHYLDQFPKDKMVQLYQFGMFISGALAAVLGIGTLWDPELFLGFELTNGKTVLFWIGALTAVYTACRSGISDQVYSLDPEDALQNVIGFTHYCPKSWERRLHTDEVRKDFLGLYKLQIVLLVEEALAMIFLPYICIFSLPTCANQLVDFFREFTIHVDGLGHVCYFAEFKPDRVGENPSTNKTAIGGGAVGIAHLRDDYYGTKDDKMMASQLGFRREYGMMPPTPQRGPHAMNGMKGSKLMFMPPPVFPGLGSPTFGGADHPGSQSRRPFQGRQSMHGKTPRFGPSASHASPMHSMLLDPHHQPAGPVVRQSPRNNPQSKQRSGGRHPLAGTAGDVAAGEGTEMAARQHRMSSDVIEEDSELGESWRTPTGDGEEDERDEEGKGAGVLGLLYQFQKAQTDGRGGM
ncbi:APG9-domain-containing protein [Aulographum hederae CBS 113979]|uniref:Autophagy-related protein 9 n=1 Tax=Aulographum hederae CBS 113979 TaxID=1176131 RepID=A0A6G1GYJ1_9PEZI|nr:APG9-domain-containing protein [Aulographum hederae CBS 113979]